MSTQNTFKQYARMSRTQLTEANFGMGMNFTNMPLPEGFSKLLVNVNISDDGMSLSPREGLSVYNKSEAGQTLEVLDPIGYKIVDCKVVHKEKDITYHHIVLSEPTEDSYRLRHMIIKDNQHSFVVSESCKHTKEPIPSIHGVEVVDNNLITPIGTFAWNGDYYYFRSDGNLMKTTWVSVTEEEPAHLTVEAVNMPGVSPRDIPTPGYNMLQKEPYVFTQTIIVGEARVFLGIVCYKTDSSGEPELNPRVNTEYKYQCYYEKGQQNDTVLWEWKEPGADTWQTIKESVLANGDEDITANFSCPAKEFMLRVTCTNSSEAVTSQLAKLYTFEENPDRQSKFINYDLSTTKNLVYWKHRLIVGGTAEDRTMLFMSLADDPGYFPYPTWTDQFPEPVQNVVPFLDSLLVFTSTQLFQITLDMEGTFSKICLQENLNINSWDRHLTQIVKNMLFFKSGNYYYMVVPKANSFTGELTIAPISKNMKEFFDGFENNVSEILKDVYDYTGPLALTHYYNFLDYESVYNVYMYKVKENLYINVCLLYNSVKRYWKINLYESKDQLFPLIQDATKSGVLVQLGTESRALSPQEIIDNEGALYKYGFHIEYLKHDANTLSEQGTIIKNHMYIDTGYREHNSDLKKRYRELQFIVDNPTCDKLDLYTNFYVDGDTRQSSYRYEPMFNITDKSVTMQKSLINPLSVPSNTLLDIWELDFSEFPGTSIWKLRAPVSGKGYSPRVVLRANNEIPFKLLKTCWIYRTMNSR